MVRDPLPKSETAVLASLSWGDMFRVEKKEGNAWSYGESEGSTKVRGWVLSKWLQPTCDRL